ncbi:MAG: hypothetical protein CVU39_19265 [Chloroflexi bacterium HGW-Chloroflexi-10]|nr:MAG: hypothetical protein CVU39_19265 [Chloroflexi bacterium HGW-Chloroflexi-10]
MKKKLIKVFLLIMGLLFSPIVLAVVAGLLFIFVKLLIGSNMFEAIQALKILINRIIPFLPYITILPAVLLVLGFIFKNTDMIKN